MQGINAVVRNAAFFPAFFLTPVVLALAALLAWRDRYRTAACWFALAVGTYLAGGLLPTLLLNVPMNEALAAVTPPNAMAEAQAIWSAYSSGWIAWNHTRAAFSGAAVLLIGLGMMAMRQR